MKINDLKKRISVLEAELGAKEKQLGQAKDRVDRSAVEIDDLFEHFKKQMLTGKETKISEVETAIQNARREAERDRVLIAGLEDVLPKLRRELDGLITERNAIFTKAALHWVRSEIDRYDEAAMASISSARRLFIVFQALKDIDQAEPMKEILGESFDYLSGLKIPTIKNFNRAQYLEARHPGLRPSGQAEIEIVLNEVMGGR